MEQEISKSLFELLCSYAGATYESDFYIFNYVNNLLNNLFLRKFLDYLSYVHIIQIIEIFVIFFIFILII